jgi:hypothetical protein
MMLSLGSTYSVFFGLRDVNDSNAYELNGSRACGWISYHHSKSSTKLKVVKMSEVEPRSLSK